MMAYTVQLPATKKDGLENCNVLMSLPTSLIHCILSDWVDVLSLIRLDFAFCRDEVFHLQLLEILNADQFYIEKFECPDNLPTYRIPPLEHPYTHMLEWIVRRKIKVVHIEPHALCSQDVLKEFLQKYGEHVRHIRNADKYNSLDKIFPFPKQGPLIEKYCRNLTEYVVGGYNATDGCILRVLNNNQRLQKLHIYGPLHGDNNPVSNHIATLHHLQELLWSNKYKFGDSLIVLVRAAPNLQKLSIVDVSIEIDDTLVLDVARACPNLRTLSCNELHFGPNDNSLRPFFATCSGIVNLDLSMHYELTDTVLIEALGELHRLHCLNLRGCSRLTDRTLQFLAQRFASTLQELYLDIWNEDMDEEGNPVVLVSSAYTTGGIASLRAQCTHLHTFHYCVEVPRNASTLLLDAYQSATIVHMCTGYEASLQMVLEHCQQMQILTMTSCAHYNSRSVWLSVDQLMAIAARCPRLHTVIIPEEEKEVDYSAVRKAFPKLVCTDDDSVADFDVFNAPI